MDITKRNNVHVIGHGTRTFLFVNGFGCDQTIWHSLTPALLSRYKLVLYDHVGAGLSDISAYDANRYSTLQGYAQDVLDICQHLALQDVVLVGHSVGGTIAALAAIAEPERFAQLMLLCPSPCYLNDEHYQGGFERLDVEQMLAFMDQDFVGWADSFASFIMGTPDRPSLSVELAHRFCQNDPVIAKRFARVTFLSDNRADMAQLRTPCLLVQCAEDLIAPPTVGEFLQMVIPGATLVTLPISGHCPHVSAPMDTLSVIESYLAA
ncbi:alpha/beta fold hydrolase [Hymenobacter sp. CRA2]|uniref:alpha/beta fold hydrolase n=1 Tax=Hymenobacter sp. CRA2 TaxID=1955620 RepID=UPI00098F3083|nr:alpha/beta hydrolase [Hymenobacter sp. CRA2]OON68689.1 hypothetical protein B0919_10870 [Hymenobacter sp. CRA2]